MLKIALGFYGFGCIAAVGFPRRRWYVLLLLPALAANAAAVGLRYHLARPMLPMHLTPAALPLLLGIMAFVAGRQDPSGRVRRIILSLALITALMAVLFPRDFYLPFLKSQCVWAHLFLLFGVAGRACFLVSAAWALSSLLPTPPGADHGSPITDHRYFRWAVWGFAFWTFSIFAGELWSYLGWGTPVVWDDPAITTVTATWFYYVCLLHLQLTGTWSARGRTVWAALGAVVVFGLNCLPEWGPFRWPF
ncbi:MAG: cytochrome c biogenesis protein CcsA [Thermodesulfobacteriota bacterium]|nr:cytochrome c biogenesis protein CcsA [Thermodesulfobacteriota bacterium]